MKTRNNKILKQTIFNFVLKFFNVLFTFLTIPIILKLLGNNKYGIWLTISSITTWLAYFDVGLGNGLRHKLSVSITNDDKLTAKEIVSTTYFIFILLMLTIAAVTISFSLFINWNEILNTNIDKNILLTIIIILITSTATRLILELANTIFLTLEKSFIKTLSETAISVSTFILIFFIEKIKINNFLTFAIIMSLIPILILCIVNLNLFKNKSEYTYLRPNFLNVKSKHIKEMFKLGINFFIIQFFGIIVFSTDNIIISHYFTPSDVTKFNITFRYFSISTFIFSIILLPYWTAFSKSYIENDTKWIKLAIKKLIILWLLQVIFVFLLIVSSDFVFKIWIGKEMLISKNILIFMGLYSIIFNWNIIFANFLNGIAKIKLQLYSATFVGLINIPLTIFFIKFTNLGVSSIILVNAICLLVSAIWSPIQCFKLINKTAKGIWAK